MESPVLIHRIRDYFERFGFEVCSRIGDIVGIPAGKVRLYFLYTSFLTFGSPIILYLVLLFFKRVRFYLRMGRRSHWYDA
ncbi:MAG: PspC family transcriptional regulator [Cryomorphaceae bacterium]|nr:PspC family transcriptional regulator [Cryomorphaceae bacterium]